MTLYQGEPSYRNLKPDEVIPQVAEVRCTKCGHDFPLRVGLWHNREAELVARIAAAVARAESAEADAHQARIERDDAWDETRRLREALAKACYEQDYCWVCDNHPSHGHAPNCFLAYGKLTASQKEG